MDLADLTHDHFAGRVGETFRDAETGAELALAQVADTTDVVQNVPEGHRAPFTLTFHGPGDTLLPQSIRRLAHDDLGELGIFLVPIAKEADGYHYEAVFS